MEQASDPNFKRPKASASQEEDRLEVKRNRYGVIVLFDAEDQADAEKFWNTIEFRYCSPEAEADSVGRYLNVSQAHRWVT